MASTTDELCVEYFEDTVLPYLRDHCNLDAEHLEHNAGNSYAFLGLDAPKDYKDVKRYNEIGVSVDTIDNPNIRTSERPIISGSIISTVGEWNEWNKKIFLWQSLVEMVYAVNLLRQMS